MEKIENPLLVKSNLDYEAPDFRKIKNKHFMPAIIKGMELQNNKISEIVKNKEKNSGLVRRSID